MDPRSEVTNPGGPHRGRYGGADSERPASEACWSRATQHDNVKLVLFGLFAVTLGAALVALELSGPTRAIMFIGASLGLIFLLAITFVTIIYHSFDKW